MYSIFPLQVELFIQHTYKIPSVPMTAVTCLCNGCLLCSTDKFVGVYPRSTMSRSSASKSASPAGGDPDPEQETDLMLYPEIQSSRCQATRYKPFYLPQCVACIRRQGGEGCRFIGVRALLRDDRKNIVGLSFPCARLPEPPDLEFPTRWNVPLLPEHIRPTKVGACHVFPPHCFHRLVGIDGRGKGTVAYSSTRTPTFISSRSHSPTARVSVPCHMR
jgi:hypothetical protein